MAIDREISRLENKVKMSLLQAEKRLVELEVAVTELKESYAKLKDIDPASLESLKELPEIKAKFDDLEDLIVVENLGVVELKKMMDEIKTKVSEPVEVSKVSAELEARIAPLEEIKTRIFEIDNLKNEIKNLDEVFRGLNEEVAKVKSKVETKPAVDFEFLLTKFNNLKKLVDDLNSRKAAMEVRLDGLERSITFLQTKRTFTPSEDLVRTVENYKSDLANLIGRIEAVEAALRNVSENILTMESKVGKYEGFERATALSKELERKLDEFKHIEDEVKRISGNMQAIYEGVDVRLDRLKNIETKFPEVNESIKRLTKEIDKNRIEILAKAKKEDIEEAAKNLEERLRSKQAPAPDVSAKIEMFERKLDENRIMLQDRVRKEEILNLLSKTNQRLDELERKIAQRTLPETRDVHTVLQEEIGPVLSAISTQISTLLDRLVALETRMGALERYFGPQPLILE